MMLLLQRWSLRSRKIQTPLLELDLQRRQSATLKMKFHRLRAPLNVATVFCKSTIFRIDRPKEWLIR
uniref:Uncharacterized protein n=1 Tax=Globodera pallida TaxID=36090 RepID=A0A183BW08_GLOPA